MLDLFYTSWKDNWSATVTSGGTTAPASGTHQNLTVSWSDAPRCIYGYRSFYAQDPAAPSELFQVFGINTGTSTWTVERGAFGTTPVTHSAGFTLEPVVPAQYLQILSDERLRFRVLPENRYISNSTTFVQVMPDFELLCESGQTYEIVFHLAIKSDPGADIKTRWSVPEGTVGTKFVVGPTSDSAGFTSQGRHEARMSGHALTTAIPYQTHTSVNDNYVIERAVITMPESEIPDSGGSIRLEFAQNTATVANTGIGVGSYVTVRQIHPYLDSGL